MWKIFNYIIISSVFSFFCLPVHAIDNEKKTDKKTGKETAKKDTVALYQGFFVEIDLAPIVTSTLINKSTYSMQGNVQLNLKNKLFPVVELGYAGADKTASSNIRYKTSGMFGKIGIEIPFVSPKTNLAVKNNFLLIGLRLGMSSFNYSYYNFSWSDNYWGGNEVLNFQSQPATKFWLEIAGGMRVNAYKNIYMGWTVRSLHLLNQAKAGALNPWYIPGYGISNSSGWGFSYIIGYKF